MVMAAEGRFVVDWRMSERAPIGLVPVREPGEADGPREDL